MVERMKTNEQAVQSEARLEPVARKVWIRPRLEVVNLHDHTEATGPGAGADGGASVS